MLTGVKTDCRVVDAELDRQFSGRAPQLSVEARRHLDECERCRKLYNHLAEEFPAQPVSREVEHRIVHTMHGSLRPVSRLRSNAAISGQLMIAFFVILAAVTSMMRVAGFWVMTLQQIIGIGTILSIGVLLLALSLAWQMKPGSLHRIPAWAAVGILGAGLLVGIVFLFPWKTPEEFLVRGGRCLRAGLTLAVPAAMVFGFLVRRGAPLSRRTLGGTLGAIAGLLAVTVLQLTCGFQDIGHLLVWHGGVLVLSTLAGVLIGESLNRMHAHYRQDV